MLDYKGTPVPIVQSNASLFPYYRIVNRHYCCHYLTRMMDSGQLLRAVLPKPLIHPILVGVSSEELLPFNKIK